MTTATPSRQQVDLARRCARYHAYKNGTNVPWFVADLDDLTQSALEAVLRRWDRRPAAMPLTAWLHLTCRSAVIDEIRRLMGKSEAKQMFTHGQVSLDEMLTVDGLEDDHSTIAKVDVLVHEDEALEDSDERERQAAAVQRCLARLPMDLATIVELCLLEDMTQVEVGELMGISGSRVNQLLRQGKAELQRSLPRALKAA